MDCLTCEGLDGFPSLALITPDISLVRNATRAVEFDDLGCGEGSDVLGVVAQVEPLLDGVPVGAHRKKIFKVQADAAEMD